MNDRLPSLLLQWVNLTQKRPGIILLGVAVLCLGMLVSTLLNFRITSDLSDMVSDDLPFRQNSLALQSAFPDLEESLVVVVRSPSPEQSSAVRDLLVERLTERVDSFHSVIAPGGGDFFQRNGLLYLSLDQLVDLSDRLADIGPFMAQLTPDMSLEKLLEISARALETDATMANDRDQSLDFLPVLNLALQRALDGSPPVPLSWQELVLGTDLNSSEQFIVIKPILGSAELPPGKRAVKAAREVLRDVERDVHPNVQFFLTGKTARNFEDIQSVKNGIGLASIISMCLVALILYLGLRSVTLVAVCLTTLLAGLVLTLGFGILVVGQLNLLSVTFVVLFIGLGIDTSLQLCLHFQEALQTAASKAQAVIRGIQKVGGALLLCCLTTTLGFMAFVPTAYKGASELGLIAGMGMVINFLINISVLPALFALTPNGLKPGNPFLRLPGSSGPALSRAALPLTITAVLLCFLALFQLPKLAFDANPMNLSNPKAESIRIAKQLFENSEHSPWTASAMRPNRDEAEQLASALGALPTVQRALTLSDFIPSHQEAKLDIISDISLFMPFSLGETSIAPSSAAGTYHALEQLSTVAADRLLRPEQLRDDQLAALADNADRLRRQLAESLTSKFSDAAAPETLITSLETSLLPNLRFLLLSLDTLLSAAPFGPEDLPSWLRQRYVSDQGVFRIQVFPEHNLFDPDNLDQFVHQIRGVAPNITGPPVNTLEAGRAISQAFQKAALWAIALIGLVLLLFVRPVNSVGLIMGSLLCSLLMTLAVCAVFEIAFNFANIIVIPLLVGIGVDFSIHLIHRFNADRDLGTPLIQTPASRGILFSGLTTMGSFGSLVFLAHQGTASMGLLLLISMGCMISVTLLFVPAFLNVLATFRRRREGR